jgi:small subunit ribosomal protein S17
MATQKKVKEAKPAAKPAVRVESETADALQRRRTVVGIVVSNKMQKTIVVKVDRRVRDTEYKKFVIRSRRYKAHDEKNDAKMGDRVMLVESRPLSREKRWALKSIVRRAGQVHDINI